MHYKPLEAKEHTKKPIIRTELNVFNHYLAMSSLGY